MPKNHRLYIVLLIIIAAATSLIFIFEMNSKNAKQVCINNSCFEVEVADTPQKRSRGLMERENLSQNAGMFFAFEKEGIYPFWMKNTLIPLDIVWIGKNMKVVRVERNAQPCKKDPCPKYNPSQKAKYVLEVNPNSGIEIGDKAIFK